MPTPTTATGPAVGLDPLDEDAAHLAARAEGAAVDEHVVGPLERDVGQPVGQRGLDGVPGRAAGSTTTTSAARRGAAAPRRSATSAPGVSQTRSSRPRPAVWCSVTSTRPGLLPRPGTLRDRRVGGRDRVLHLDPPPRGDRQPGEIEGWARCRCVCHGTRLPQSRPPSPRVGEPSATSQPTGGHRVSAQPGEGTDVPPQRWASTSTPPPGKLADLERRLDEAVHAGSEKAIEKQHAKGRRTARERIEMLFDEGTFVELDELARHRSTAFGLEKNRPYGDGVVTGYGEVNGRMVCVFSQDFTVFGGSLGEVYGEKITKVMDLAMKTGCPIIGINEGAGARIQEGVVSPRPLRRDLPPQRARLGRHPADQPDHGQLRRRPRLLPRRHRLHRDGRPDLGDVHHRTRRHQDRHRRGRHDGGPRRRAHPQHQVRQRPLHGLRRGGRHRVRQGDAVVPPAEQPRPGADLRRGARHGGHRHRPGAGHGSSPTARTSPTTCTT